MKPVYIVLLVFIIASCAKNNIEIKSSDIKKNLDSINIKTSSAENDEESQYTPKEPQIKILSPKNFGVINQNTAIIVLNVSNFKLVSPDRYPKKNEGLVQVWFDNIWLRDSNSIFVFENISNGTHAVRAELVMSNYTVLPYNDTINVFVDIT